MYFVEVELNPYNEEGINTTRWLHDPYSQTSVLTRGQWRQVLNAVADFQFDLLPNHPLYDAPIRSHVSLVRIRDENENIIFRGRIVDFSRQMTSSGQMKKSYVVECELAFLLDSMQEAEELVNVTSEEYLKRVLSVHNERVERTLGSRHNKRIDGIVIDDGDEIVIPDVFDPSCFCGKGTNTYHINYTSTFKNIKEQLIGSYGGYLWLSYDGARRILHYSQVSGKLRNMSIELATNLESLQSTYSPSQDFTRLIPLGAELERYELGINRLEQVGILEHAIGRPVVTSPHFWQSEIRYHRDGTPLEDQAPISEWSGQLLLGLATLNYNTDCTCEEACGGVNGRCESCVTVADDYIEKLMDLHRPNVNSRMAYNRAVDFLCNSGVIGSSEYWKEDENFQVLPLRSLIRLAALTVSVSSPRRGDSTRWLDEGDGSWVNDDDDLIITGPPDDSGGGNDGGGNNGGGGSDDGGGNNGGGGSDDRDPDLPPPPPPPDETDSDDIDSSVREISIDSYFAGIEVPEGLSPWIPQLLAKLSQLNLEDVTPAQMNAYRDAINDDIGNTVLYEQALDSLANSGVLHSPNYWKQEHLSRSRSLRLLIRLANRLVNKLEPIRMNPRDALRFLRRHRLVTVAEREFWDGELDKIEAIKAEAENEDRDPFADPLPEPFSDWIPELLSSLTLINFELALEQYGSDSYSEMINGLRETIRPISGRIPDINDEGAYYEAVDSLSNAGAISSQDYWKEPARRRIPALRWLIRLADLLVDKNKPQSDFPRPRLNIESVNGGQNWLPISGDENAPIIEGIVTFDTNDPTELKNKAERWIRDHQTMTNSVSVSALDLSQLDEAYDDFKVGDRYEVINPLIGVEANGEGFVLNEKSIDVVNPTKSSLTFGDRPMMMSSSN